jgi:hypothetical protein
MMTGAVFDSVDSESTRHSRWQRSHWKNSVLIMPPIVALVSMIRSDSAITDNDRRAVAAKGKRELRARKMDHLLSLCKELP